LQDQLSSAIQNQASHVTFNSGSPEGRAAGDTNPPLISQGTTIKRHGIPMGREFGLSDEKTQSGWRMIV
jgi:hypothetical protein